MIEYTNLDKINNITNDNFYVVTDFDNTITTKDSNTTFSLFGASGLYPEEYNLERQKHYDYYRPLELDLSLSNEDRLKLSIEWLMASFNLMLKYQVKESDIEKIISFKDSLKLRKQAIEFIKLLNIHEIPLIINSAGVGNFIIESLKQNGCYDKNIFVNSNMLQFKNNEIVDKLDPIVHNMNKYDINLPNEYKNKLLNKEYAIVIGDQISDVNMAKKLPKKDTLSMGFLESNVEENRNAFKKKYDIVLTNNESFYSIIKTLKLK
ncbi:MAG: hypothetical protein IJ574_02850 [Bacilli bacterium]|nr:hypothetical protein [Bacilli bacterium]